MRLVGPIAVFLLLLFGCTPNQQEPTLVEPVEVSASTLVSPSPTPTRGATPTPEPKPTATIAANGGPSTPCRFSRTLPYDGRQTAFLEWSSDGSALLFDFDGSYRHEQAIWQVRADGSYLRRVANPIPYSPDVPRFGTRFGTRFGFHGSLSPDGKQLVYSTCEYGKESGLPSEEEPSPRYYELAIVDLKGGDPRRLTNSLATDDYPAWSPDGSRIAYVGMYKHIYYYPSDASMWVVSADYDGHAPHPRRVGNTLRPAERAPVWSPDGQHIAVISDAANGTGNVYVLTVGEGVRPSSTTLVGESSISPSWSPDAMHLVLAWHL